MADSKTEAGEVQGRQDSLIMSESRKRTETDGEWAKRHKNQLKGQIWDSLSIITSHDMIVYNPLNFLNPQTNIDSTKKKKKGQKESFS